MCILWHPIPSFQVIGQYDDVKCKLAMCVLQDVANTDAVSNGVISDKTGCKNGIMSFQMNPVSVYSIIMAVFVFGGIVENAHCLLAFDIVILAHHME